MGIYQITGGVSGGAANVSGLSIVGLTEEAAILYPIMLSKFQNWGSNALNIGLCLIKVVTENDSILAAIAALTIGQKAASTSKRVAKTVGKLGLYIGLFLLSSVIAVGVADCLINDDE